jgi:glycosyltransferase involved in cell wall biosynthesis
MKNVLYIGNKPSPKTATPTSLQTLGKLLREEGYTVRTASSAKSKPIRLIAMCLAVIRFRKVTDIVLIDTYSTHNFYYAVAVAKVCRFFKLPYIPILHGGNLPERLFKSRKLSNALFGEAKCNIAPSGYLLQAFRQVGFQNLESIPNTIEIKNYPFLQRNKVRPRLLWVRSFSKVYNPELALEVVEILQKKYPDTQLCMVGPEADGSLKDCRESGHRKNLNV